MGNQGKSSFILAITLVATLGGLLFGYDTAVISGATKALKEFFVLPLYADAALASTVIIQYKVIITFCFVLIASLLGNFFIRLFGKKKGAVYTLMLFVAGVVVLYTQSWSQPNELTENIANSINGFTISSALIGCIIGGSIGGFISNRIGRKRGLILAALLFTFSAVGSAIPDILNLMGAGVISSFIFYRVIGGIGVGIASMLSPMYIAEIAPANIRGKLVSFNQFAIIFGMLVVYFVNYAIARQGDDQWIMETGWRWMFASETIPAIVFFTLLFFVPETPRYLVRKNKTDAAKSVLNKLVGSEKAKLVLSEIKETMSEKSVSWLSYGGLVIFIGVMLSVFQQFVGINVVLYYAPEIFRNMGSNTDASLLQTIIVGAINLTFTVVAILTVDKLGRKPLMIIGSLGMAVAMGCLGFTFFWGNQGFAALIFMLVYVAAFAVSWGPVTWVMLSEIFPNSIRAAMSIAVAAQWIANLIVSWTFPIMNDNSWLTNLFHHGFSYWIYGIMGIVSALFMWKIVPETKGKTLEEMQKLWKK
ncbi:MAG: D-xylose transporter XylE [Chlorobi bacterium]|nr:D-xylose transporter XylE [Chlorobiota bacterium]